MPVEELASWLGFTIATFPQDDYAPGTYGWLEPGEDVVWLCRNLSPQLRRFTLAHELGHVVLHRKTGHAAPLLLPVLATPFQPPDSEVLSENQCQEVDVREEVMGPLDQEYMEEVLGIGQAYDPRSQRELAANMFAAELLMPRARIEVLYLKAQLPANTLASIFDVSQGALLNRLAGFLKGPNTRRGVPLQVMGTETPVASCPPKKRYDEFQQAAIEAPTPALIVAGPGSGKTSTLIGRVEYLVHTLGVQPQQILALTFSRKAAQEMQERLGLALQAQQGLPTVSTFHAFCAELLRTYGEQVGLREGFTFVDDAEGYFLLRRLAAELPLRYYQNLAVPTLHFPPILSAISRAKDELVTPAHYKELAERMLERARSEEEVERAEKALELAELYAIYQAGLQRQGDVDFGGLLMLAVHLLQTYPDVRRTQQQKYQHILVDEFQDINRASGVLLRELAGAEQRVWVVGDANQAIYGFRGASPANIASFHDDYPNAVILPLSRNYRSRPDIVNLADAFRQKQLEPDRQADGTSTARTTQPEPYVTLAVAKDEASELNGLLAGIGRKHAQGYAYRDIVVLCRTRSQMRKVTRALNLAHLPVMERGSMLEQEHIKDLLSIVLLIADQSGRGILRAARQKEHPLSQSDIEALLLEAHTQKVPPGQLITYNETSLAVNTKGSQALTRLSHILQTLQHTRSVWELLAHYLCIETTLLRDLLCATDDEQARAKLADYASMLELARFYDQRQQVLRAQSTEAPLADTPVDPSLFVEIPFTSIPRAAQPTIKEQAKGFLDYLSILLTLRQDGGGRRESTDGHDELPDVIRVMTVHASKGLEFPVVYLPGLVQRRFPAQKRAHPAPPPAGMLAPESEGDTAHETGEACLFYVGATRARDELILSYSERYGKMNYKRSPYIDALVAGLPQERITRVLWQDTADTPALEAIVNEQLPSSQPGEHFIQAVQPTTLSVSALDTYQTCPRKYAYSYLYHFQVDEGAYQLFWQATRTTFEALRQQLSIGSREPSTNGAARLPTPAEAQELYSHYWQAIGGHELPFAAIYEQHGREVMQSIGAILADEKDGNTVTPRQSFEAEVAGKTIRVEVDRVEEPAQDGEPIKLVRHRFGRRKEQPTATTRELLSMLGYRQQHPGQDIELQEHNLSTSQKVSIKLTEKKRQNLYDELEKALQGLEHHEYPPKPDARTCPSCPFFLICPA